MTRNEWEREMGCDSEMTAVRTKPRSPSAPGPVCGWDAIAPQLLLGVLLLRCRKHNAFTDKALSLHDKIVLKIHESN